VKPDRDLNMLVEPFRSKAKKFLELCPDIFCTEAYRTPGRQAELYKKKLSHLDGVNKISEHQKGLAIDIAFHGNELYPLNHQTWRGVADIAKECGLDWGYDLWAHTGFIDNPHFQDNGKSTNNNGMHDYISMAEEIKEPILTNMEGENTLSEGQVKALINIAVDRAVARLIEKLTK